MCHCTTYLYSPCTFVVPQREELRQTTGRIIKVQSVAQDVMGDDLKLVKVGKKVSPNTTASVCVHAEWREWGAPTLACLLSRFLGASSGSWPFWLLFSWTAAVINALYGRVPNINLIHPIGKSLQKQKSMYMVLTPSIKTSIYNPLSIWVLSGLIRAL